MFFLKFFILINHMILLLMILFILNYKIHPLLLMINLISFSMIMCFYMSLWKNNYLFSLILFLIMISGLFIIFLYFSSMISNELLNIFFNKMLIIFIFINLFTLIILNKNFLNLYLYSFFSEINNSNYLNSNQFMNIIYIYNYPFNNLSLLTLIFLLFSMMIIIKMCMKNSSSLRKLF